jgi:hypothetical protein
MRILNCFRVRKLIGKLGVPYNRRLGVRGFPHPHFQGKFWTPPAAAMSALRIHSDLLSGDASTAACITRLSSGESRAFTMIPRNLALATLGRPIFDFIKIVFVKRKYPLTKCKT